MLHTTIRDDMQRAMKEKDQVRLNTLRLVLAACTETLVANRRKPTELLNDDETVAVLRKIAKQRRESADQYRSAGDGDRAAAEDAERAVIEPYLPPSLSEEDIRAAVCRHKESLGVSEKKDTGRLIKEVMREIGDRADGSEVARIAAGELS